LFKQPKQIPWNFARRNVVKKRAQERYKFHRISPAEAIDDPVERARMVSELKEAAERKEKQSIAKQKYLNKKLGAPKKYIKPACDFIMGQRSDMAMYYDRLRWWFETYSDDPVGKVLIEDKRQKIWESYNWAQDRWLCALLNPDDDNDLIPDDWELYSFKGCSIDQLPDWEEERVRRLDSKGIDDLLKEPASQKWRARQEAAEEEAERRAREKVKRALDEEAVEEPKDLPSLWSRREEKISWNYIMSIRNGRR
jgi:hypothetical protein